METNIRLVLWNGLIKLQKIMMVITGFATVFFVFIPMVMRIVGISFIGYEEILLTVAFWMYMMGSSYGSYERSQICADLLGQYLVGRKKDVLSLVGVTGTFVLGIIFTYWGFILLKWSLSTGSTSSTFKIPYTVGQSSIFVSLIITSFYNFVYMIKEYRIVFMKENIKWE